MKRRNFVRQLSAITIATTIPGWAHALAAAAEKGSPLGKLTPVGRAMETAGYYVWCSCPIDGPDGKVHLFYSRWNAAKKMGGWLNGSEIAHAVADSPESDFKYTDTVLTPRGNGFWDATTCHNPMIKKIGDTYYLFFMGNSNGKTNTKRIGLATAASLYGPWKRCDEPLLLPGPAGAWDDHCTTNPSLIEHPDGKYWLYYKSWNTHDYLTDTTEIKGNRKYGLAIAEKPEGPYIKYAGNPVIDFSGKGDNKQLEDAFVWRQHNRFNMVARDMGVFNHEAGIFMDSKKGIHWSDPEIAYNALTQYVKEPDAPVHLKKYGRLERPMLLIRNGKPAYLFGAAQGGKFMTSSTFIFRIN